MTPRPPVSAPEGPPGPGGDATPGRPTERTAVVALVTGLVGLWPAGLLTGAVALRRTRHGRRRGRGLAVAGLVLSSLWCAVTAVVVTVVLAGGSLGAGATKNVFALTVGDCVNGVSGTGHETEEFASAPVVPCDQPHEAEVITSFELDERGFGRDQGYPGEEALVAASQEGCLELMEAELRDAEPPASARHGELTPFFFYPTAESWERADDRTVHCLAMTPHGPASGSLLDP